MKDLHAELDASQKSVIEDEHEEVMVTHLSPTSSDLGM